MERVTLDSLNESCFNSNLIEEELVNEVIGILEVCNMVEEKEKLLDVLSKSNKRCELLHSQENSFYDLKNDIQGLNDDKAKALLYDLLNEIRAEYKVERNRFIKHKKAILGKCILLNAVFKTSGEAIFRKAFAETIELLEFF